MIYTETIIMQKNTKTPMTKVIATFINKQVVIYAVGEKATLSIQIFSSF